MNRRAFLGAIGLAPVAAVAAAAGPAYASGGYVRNATRGVVGEFAPETIIPWKVINVLDPSSVAGYLKTEEGERLIINAVRRNG